MVIVLIICRLTAAYHKKYSLFIFCTYIRLVFISIHTNILGKPRMNKYRNKGCVDTD